MTRTEFFDWLVFLRMEEERLTKLDHYLAQIASEVRRTNVKHPNKVRTKDFLLRYEDAKDPRRESKSVWLSAVGLKPKK